MIQVLAQDFFFGVGGRGNVFISAKSTLQHNYNFFLILDRLIGTGKELPIWSTLALTVLPEKRVSVKSGFTKKLTI